MPSLLATGTSAAQSADFSLTGEVSTLFLVSTAAIPIGAYVELQIKGSNGVYYAVGSLSSSQNVLVISGPGTYRVSRSAGVDVGVDRF